MTTNRPLILLTNDDGVRSPGLAASAAALAPLGDLLIVAPAEQQSGMGRSMPVFNTGSIATTRIHAGSQSWPAYGADASPAQAVQHGVLELCRQKPLLAVSGINFGENVGTAVSISGTVGAALEAAAFGIRALAVSLQVDPTLHVHYDDSVDFSAAIYFTRYFAEKCLQSNGLPDVDVLKIDIPARATPDTPWRVTRLERHRYYRPLPPERTNLSDPGRIDYTVADPLKTSGPDTDVQALVEGVVSVTPLSLDMTSRIGLEMLQDILG